MPYPFKTALLLALVRSSFAGADPTTNPSIPGKPGVPIELFDGRDLNGWVEVDRPPTTQKTSPPSTRPASVWTVQNGLIHDAGNPYGYLRTIALSPENFILDVEQRHVNKGNGGIFIALTGPDKVWPKEIEIQGLCGDEGDIRNIRLFDFTADPARTEPKRIRKIGPSSEKPIGQWDEIRILVDAGHIEVFVNGVLQNLAWYRGSLRGHIALQAEGGEMEFRKVELTSFDETTGGARPE